MMKTISFDRWIVCLATAAMGCAVMEAATAGAPSQTPLLGAQPIAPNVMFTLDDSGSMLNALMPEEYSSGQYEVSQRNSSGNPTAYRIGVAIQTLTPQEQQNIPASIDSNYGYNNQLIPTRLYDSANPDTLDDAKRRSSRFNTIYYNPEVRYTPWVRANADGTITTMSYPAPQANGDWIVPLDPILGNTGGASKVNLSKTGALAFSNGGLDSANNILAITATDATVTWCAVPVSVTGTTFSRVATPRPGIPGNACQTLDPTNTAPSAATQRQNLVNSYDPAVFYEFNEAGTVPTRISLNSASVTTLTRGKNRTDCSVSNNEATCTRAQEYKNFATWFVYYRTRLLLAKAAVAKAFSDPTLKDFRLGYGALNNPSGGTASASAVAIDGGSSTLTLVSGVRDFLSSRAAFYTWLFNKIAYNGTPLRRATDDVGKYYSRQDARSPWSDDPGLSSSTQTPSNFAGCRKSFHILTTDGYWSDGDAYAAGTSAARANVDGTSNTTPIVEYNADGTIKRQYTYNTNSDGNARYVDNRSDMLADVAMYYWNHDLMPSTPNNGYSDERDPAFWQHMVNYTVGLGTSGNINPLTLTGTETVAPPWPNSSQTLTDKLKADDLVHAAYNTRGKGLSASNADVFAASLVNILTDINNRSYPTAGVGVSSATVSDGFAIYEPGYVAGNWTGSLKKFFINPTTGNRIDSDRSTLDVVDPTWSAGNHIPAASVRNILVWNGSAATPFLFPNLSDAMKTEMATSLTPTLDVVNYLRGDNTYEGAGNTSFRARSGDLGDIVNSNPLLVKDTVDFQYTTLPFAAAATYGSFLRTLKNREAMVFAGANDGMLHGFLDSTGAEVFAFIPREVLPKLGYLTGRVTGQTSPPSYSHRYFVDGPITETHAYIGSDWKSLLIGSMGAGGKGLFAIDITAPTVLKTSTGAIGAIKWELNSSTSSAMGHVYDEIEVGPIKVGNDYKWVALVGNGFNSVSLRAQLLVVDVSNGAILATLDTNAGGTATPNGLGGVRSARDRYGVIQAAYAGDELGNVWRFNLNSGSASTWSVAFNRNPLFRATDTDTTAKPQSITAAPSVIRHPKGGSMIVVGTGKLIESTDRVDAPITPGPGLTGKLTQMQSIYGIWDKSERALAPTALPGITKSNLVQQTIDNTAIIASDNSTYYNISNNQVDWATKSGWYMNLTLATGQRMIYPSQTIKNFVLLNTVVPASTGACGDSTSYNAILNAINGTVDNRALFDINGDGAVTSSDRIASWYVSETDGRERLVRGGVRQSTAEGTGGSSVKNKCDGSYQLFAAKGPGKCIPLIDTVGARTWRILVNPPRP